jgi:hypothetical protein
MLNGKHFIIDNFLCILWKVSDMQQTPWHQCKSGRWTMSYHNFSNPIEMLMIHFFWWSFPSFEVSFSESKIASSFNSTNSNQVVKLVCPNGLPTFVAHVPNLSQKNVPLLKKPKKNYDILHKCKEVWTTQLPCVEMFKNNSKKVNKMKCIVCSFVKGKIVFFGPKVDTFENMLEK